MASFNNEFLPEPFETANGSPSLKAVDEDKVEPVAIIGLSLKFPQDATSPESFWKMLVEARSAMTEIPKDRFNLDAYYNSDSEKPGTINIKGAHFVKEDIAAFDAPFFSITPAEASCMDPQQRGLLECTYHALENAGLRMENVSGTKTSVHVGCWTREYESLFQRDHEMQAKYLATGTGNAMTANRLSWFYDLRGPSIAIDTACSSSLNALHLACQALHSREATMSLVGGCNLFYNADAIAPLTNLKFLGPDSVCYSFDHRANGYARGEGFAVVVLKLLCDALRDGDTIRAVIRATGSNQDGRTPGITQPSSQAQEDLIRDTYDRGGLDLKTTRFFEAHGTGTPVGDPLEASAIGAVFQRERSEEEPLLVGAVKSNIGHLEGASGIAGLIKTVLVLEHGLVPPNIWFEKPNPKIAPEWNLKFPTKTTLWPTEGLRRASVNSFGYGGTNAHVVLDDAYHYLELRKLSGRHCTVKSPNLPRPSSVITLANGHVNNRTDSHINSHTSGDNELNNVYSNDTKSLTDGNRNGIKNLSNDHSSTRKFDYIPSHARPRIFVWSSSDENGLKRHNSTYKSYLHSLPKLEDESAFLDDLAYTMTFKRSTFPWKVSVPAGSISELLETLENGFPKPVRSAATPKLGFVFTGQGAQWHAMGNELTIYPAYKDSLVSADEYLRSLGCKWSLIAELQKDAAASNIDSPTFSQPICAVVQMALVDLLRSFGIQPMAVVGHSSGEIAAAYCARAISRTSGWKIAYYRGLVSGALRKFGRSRGGMMAVGLSEAAVQKYLDGEHTKGAIVGCVNSPSNVTLTGNVESLTTLQSSFTKDNVFCRMLKVENAYHSNSMDEVALEYWKLLGTIKAGVTPPAKAEIPIMFSSVTGQRITASQVCEPEYWVQNLVSPVRFSDALLQMLSQPSATRIKKLGVRNKFQGLDINFLLEVGPHGALRRSIKEILDSIVNGSSISYDSLLTQNISSLNTSLAVMCRLICLGLPFDLMALNNPDCQDRQMLIDLPQYPFNHTQRYWSESRLSKNIRFRKYARNELLGSQVPDWNSTEARWRMYIRLSESEWIKDHRITGNALYPGAGMLVMAIEAAGQLANLEKKIVGYHLKEIVFDKALTIPATVDGIEIEFYMRPVMYSNFGRSKLWNEFKLCSYDNNEWRDHCRGNISIEYGVEPTGADRGLEMKKSAERFIQYKQEVARRCNISVDSSSMYEICETYGLCFGPSFQNLTSIRYNMQKEAVASIQIKDAVKPNDTTRKYVIHPTTLDGILQTIFPALSKGGQEPIQTVIPSFIQDLWISSMICRSDGEEPIHACVKAKKRGFREAECTILASHTSSGDICASVKGFRVTSVANKEASQEQGWRRLCFNVDWRPDIDLLDVQQAKHLFRAPKTSPTFPPDQRNEDMEFIGFYFISKSLKYVEANNITQPKKHLQKYIGWMKHQIGKYENGTLLHGRPEWTDLINDQAYVDKVLQSLEDSHEGRLALRIGPNLPAILSGDVDPLELLFKDDLLPNLYRWGMGADIGYEKIEQYVEALCHKNPNLNILEIGAGTGGTTIPIFETLTRHGEEEEGAPRYSHYMYTDISPSFFEKAKETFKDHLDRMTFKVLDIEHDPVKQGFEEGVYDLVVASNVIHATKDLDVTLRNTRRLLKPGGKLLLFEICNPDIIRGGFAFGLLPGWWLSVEPNRKWGPLMYESDWDSFLSRNGFSGNDVALRDYQDERNHMTSVLVSSASGGNRNIKPVPNAVIIIDENSKTQQTIARELKHHLEALGSSNCSICPVGDVPHISLEKKFCVFLPELDCPFLANIDESSYACLQKLVADSHGLLWLTRSGPQSAYNPNFELVIGFARSIRSENNSVKFTTLALETFDQPLKVVENAIKVFKATTLQPHDEVEEEFKEKDGVIYINRIVEANYLNDDISRRQYLQRAEPQPFSNKRPVKLTIASPGILDTLQFIDDLDYGKPLGDDEVELEVKATSMNFLDVMIALAQIPEDFLGGECSGIVTRAGKNSRYKAGDRVWTGTIDAYRTFARTPDALVQKMPKDMSFAEAASLPIVYGTCYYAMYDIARLKAGEKILIHSAAGGVGQAAIWLAKLVDAEIFATVGTDEKRQFLEQTFGIPQDHIFSSRSTTFAQEIMHVTNGRGVDVALNSLAGEGLRVTWDCMAPFGRFLEIGKKDIFSFGNLPMFPFAKNVSFAAVDLLFIMRHDLKLAKRIFDDVKNLAEAQKIKAPQPIHTYSYANIEDAFRVLQSGKHIGKIVIEPKAGDIVPIVPDSRPIYHFDGDATYVIAGGLGGLGRSMARWMVRRGAKSLLLLSRSGASTASSQGLVSELKAMGCNVATPRCDVSKEKELQTVLGECMKYMPAVKGCIQGAMVLKDSIFSNMSLADYRAAVGPKVNGSWNLHKLLPANMDFFILLSSGSGVFGGPSQSNYGSGNTYQDALARYRVSQGEKAVSLDLGMILSVGFAAERPETMDMLRSRGYMPIRETEFLGMLEYYCNPNLAVQSAFKAQVATGIETPASLKAKGIEEPFWMPKPLFRNMYQMDNIKTDSADAADTFGDFEALLGAMKSLPEAGSLIAEAIVKKLAKALSTPMEDIDSSKPMHVYGVDSLVAVELRNWLAKEIRADVAVFDLMDAVSIAELGILIAGKSQYLPTFSEEEE